MKNPLHNDDDYFRDLRFFAYAASEDLLRLTEDRTTVIMGARSTTTEVRIDGQEVDGAACAYGCGLIRLPTAPLRVLARKCDGLGIEARLDGTFVLLPTNDDERDAPQGVHFAATGHVVAPVKRSRL